MPKQKYVLIKNEEDDDGEEVPAVKGRFIYEKHLQPKHLIVFCFFVLMINVFYAQSAFNSDAKSNLTDVTNNIMNETTTIQMQHSSTTRILPSNLTIATTHLTTTKTTTIHQTQDLSTTTTIVPINLTITTKHLTPNSTKTPQQIQHLSTTTTTLPFNLSTTTKHLPPTKTTTIAQTSVKYFINTSQCRVPFVDPFSKEALKIFNPKKFKYSNCTNDEPFITTNYQRNAQKYLLHMNMPAIERAVRRLNASVTDVRCCYQQIVNIESDDNKYKLLPCSIFQQDFTLPEQIDYILTECYVTKNKTKKTIQKDAFSFIQQHKAPPSVIGQIQETFSRLGTKRPSILLLGIDSLSRINLRRTMPKTFRYLQDNRWFELQGYNKVGDNTFPNLMALLTSYNATTAYDKCKPKTKGGLSKPICNLIWNNFRDYGYKTAYAEDSWSMSTFNYLKKGFEQPPTTYYLRPMTIAIAKNLKVKKTAGIVNCVGRRHYGEYIFDYALQFANTLADDPLFGLFWTNSFSHNSFDTTATMDARMLKYLERMKADGIFERAIVLFFADHGVRWGPLLQLKSGFLEERLPMMFISLPAWYRNAYPEFVKALEINQHRLTSPYDIYATLKHILAVAVPSKQFLYLNDTIKGVSIFSEIPENRTCQDAGITEHWCTCWPYEVLPKTDSIAKKVTNLVLKEINEYLAGKNVSSKCSDLTLNSLVKVEMKIHEVTNHSTYRVEFVANPKKAQFQATAIYNGNANEIKTNVEDISRLDSYAKTAGCIDLKVAQKYCVCKDGARRKT